MKVLLTHGYFIAEDPVEQKIMKPYPPLGLLYISAFLNEYQIENNVFDSTFESFENLIEKIKKYQPDAIGIYTNLMTKVNIVNIIKNINNISTSKIILGGPDITYNIENYLNAGADYLIIGEGEQTMLELVLAIKQKADKNLVDGIAFRDSQGKIVKTKARTKTKELDSLPLPNRDAIDINKYISTHKQYHGKSELNISTQRGCPYTCKWCSTAVYGQSYRRRSPEKVVEELLHLKSKYKPDSIWFVDDVFTVSHKWLKNLAEQIEKHEAHIPFECISRADRMNEEVIAILKKMGCFRIWIGAESGSQKIIDAMDRRVNIHEVQQMIIEAKKQGIETGTFVMVGYPTETEEDIKETLNHLLISNPDHFTITKAYPIKGTSLYDEVNITTNNNWETSTDRDIDFTRTYTSKYYQHAIKWIVSRVNLHKHHLEHSMLNSTALRLILKTFKARFGMWITK